MPSPYSTPEARAETERLIAEVLAEENLSENIARSEQSGRQDLTSTPDGGFLYKGKRLQSLSTDSKHGKLLHFLLMGENSTASDAEIRHAVGVGDGRDFGFVLRNLKRTLRNDGLKLLVERRRSLSGYVYLGVRPLPQPPRRRGTRGRTKARK